MDASAEDVTFGDFSALCLEEYQALFREPLQSSDVEFPWDDKSQLKSNSVNVGAGGTASCTLALQQEPSQSIAASKDPSTQGPYCIEKYVAGEPVMDTRADEYADPAEPKQWSGPALAESQEQGADGGIMGYDPQSEEGERKRRNKKRRDPEYYKKYYNRVGTDGSFDNDSSAENGGNGVREDEQYACGTDKYAAAALQTDYKVESNTAPTPGYEYNADNKSVERTSACVQPTAATNPSSGYTPAQIILSDDKEVKSSNNVESCTSEDITQQVSSAIAINVEKGNVFEAQPEPNVNAGSESCSNFDVPVSSHVPSVPAIHISPSENAASNTSSGESFDESFPAAVSEVPEPSQAPSTPSPAPAAPPAIKSWASLFKAGGPGGQTGNSSSAPHVAISVTEPYPGDEQGDDMVSLVTTDKDPHAKRLGEHLSKVIPSHHPMNLQPRGLINTANWCYINSILQALLSCPPFYHIMKNLPLSNGVRKSSSTPMLDAMYQFLKEFQEVKGLSKRSSNDIRPGMSFEPSNIYQMLSVAQTSLVVKQGRQEDAEEFLSCLLSGLHDEMTSLIQSVNGESPQAADSKQNGPSTVTVANGDMGNGHEGSDEDEWEQVGPRNKTSITRRAQFSSSPLSKIFGGIMRSALHQHGSKESATLQPFFSLPLDIQCPDIWNVQHALDMLGNKESVHGFMSNKTKKEVEAFRRITLEELPPVLILHLKRFLYDKSGGCQKLMKKVDYSMEIEILKDLISPNAKSRISVTQRFYKLFAVVYHTGKDASGGHYITDVYHVGTSGWLRCDDSIVKPVKSTQVTKPIATCIPYLLFYRRKDLLTKPTTS